MAAACLYYAGRAENISTPLHKLVEYSGLSKHNIVICFYSLIKTFKINSPPVSPMSMLSKHISDLHLSHSCEMLVLELMNFYMKSKLFAGKDPKGLVAAAIYFVILKKNINRTQKDIVEHVGVSEVTMRKRLVEIYELVDRLHKR